jgi:hypothetical protein
MGIHFLQDVLNGLYSTRFAPISANAVAPLSQFG